MERIEVKQFSQEVFRDMWNVENQVCRVPPPPFCLLRCSVQYKLAGGHVCAVWFAVSASRPHGVARVRLCIDRLQVSKEDFVKAFLGAVQRLLQPIKEVAIESKIKEEHIEAKIEMETGTKPAKKTRPWRDALQRKLRCECF